jgi:hypothetical protein
MNFIPTPLFRDEPKKTFLDREMNLTPTQVVLPPPTSRGWGEAPTVASETPSVEGPTVAATTMPITAQGSSCRFKKCRLSIEKLVGKSGSDVEFVGIMLFAGRAQVTKI